MTATIDPKQFLDPVWRISNLYEIIDKDGHRVPFRPTGVQLAFLEELHGRDIILKARQMGFTTLMGVVGTDECVFNPDWSCAIVAHRLADAKKIFETKVKLPDDSRPQGIKDRVRPIKDSADTLSLSNGSTFEVTSSARSGTLQRLHISEFGKICAQYPKKAREVITGSFPAAENGQITVESTAEGQEGRFFEMCQTAQGYGDKPIAEKQYKFHFFPWHEQQEYRADPDGVIITAEDKLYFARLAADGIELDDAQKAWYVLTEKDQGGDMKREDPSTPAEAFEQAIEGAIFERQIAHANKHGHIGPHSYDPLYPVNSFWDIGRNDLNCIWLHQHIKGRNRFIGYYESSGEFIAHYVGWLRDWKKEHDASFDNHYLPHDANRQDLFLENGRMAVMDDLGFRPEIVRRPADKWEAVETARTIFASCDFDEVQCAKGLQRLRHYRKEWDDMRETFRNRPLHDDNSNAADAFMTFSSGFDAPVKSVELKLPELGMIA